MSKRAGVWRMSLPNERARAIINTRNYLRRMLSPYNGGIKKIPKEVRRECRYLLKHFSSTYELIRAVKPKNKYICADELNRINQEEILEWEKK